MTRLMRVYILTALINFLFIILITAGAPLDFFTPEYQNTDILFMFLFLNTIVFIPAAMLLGAAVGFFPFGLLLVTAGIFFLDT